MRASTENRIFAARCGVVQSPTYSPSADLFTRIANAEFEAKRAKFYWRPLFTIYVASDGQSSNPGTIGEPWDIAKLVAEFAAGNIKDYTEILFKSGDTFQIDATVPTYFLGDAVFDTDGLTAIRFGAYGTGEKPFFTPVPKVYTSGWTLVSGNVYSRTETDDIAWIIDPAQELVPFRRDVDSTMADGVVPNTVGSFWYQADSDTLYVEMLDGSDPNNTTLHGVVSNDWVCFNFRGDLCYSEGLKANRYGLSRLSGGVTQGGGFRSQTLGSNISGCFDCETYYSGSHVLHHNGSSAGSGGTFVVENCKAGYMAYYNQLTGTVYNSYAGNGGQSYYSRGCESTYGHLPDSGWHSQAGVNNQVNGTTFYCHTSGAPGDEAGRIIVIDQTSPDNPFGCPGYCNGQNVNSYTDVFDASMLFIGEVVESTRPNFNHWPRIVPWKGFRINANIKIRMSNPTGRAVSVSFMPGSSKGECWNCRFDLDVQNVSSGNFAWVNGNNDFGSEIFKHCDFIVRNPDNITRIMYCFDLGTFADDTFFHNCRFGILDGTTTDWYDRGSPNFVNCGFFNQDNRGTNPVALTVVEELDSDFIPSPGDESYNTGDESLRLPFNRLGKSRGVLTNLGSL